MAMSDEYDINRFLAMHVRTLYIVDPFDKAVKAMCDLLCRSTPQIKPLVFVACAEQNHLLAIFAAISPDIPRRIFIKSLLLPSCADIFRQETFILAIVPLGKFFRDADFVLFFKCFLPNIVEEKVKGLLRAFAWTDKHMCELRGLDQLSGADEHLARPKDLVHTIVRQSQLSHTGIPSVLRPFSFACR